MLLLGKWTSTGSGPEPQEAICSLKGCGFPEMGKEARDPVVGGGWMRRPSAGPLWALTQAAVSPPRGRTSVHSQTHGLSERDEACCAVQVPHPGHFRDGQTEAREET